MRGRRARRRSRSRRGRSSGETLPEALDKRAASEKTCAITADAFPSPPDYGRSLPGFCANLLVRDVGRALPFYRDCLGATVRYVDDEFAALVLAGTPLMLHRDSTYETHPWHGDLVAGGLRGLGAELRLFGVDPDDLAARAEATGGTIVADAADKPHGWREAFLADPDGYVWAVGSAI